MRLTAQVISNAPIVLNPEGQLTLQLRQLKISFIENLGITQDKFKVIDLIDNELSEVSDIPLLKNLEVLLLANNKIYTIKDDDENIFLQNLPNLKSITLSNNNIARFSDIKALSSSHIQILSLLGNPIQLLENYRLFIIWLIPSLRVLDFIKVKDSERKLAKEMFGDDINQPSEQALLAFGQESEAYGQNITKEEKAMQSVLQKLTDEEKANLLKQLETSESLEEIERIEETLKKGYY